MKHVGYFRSNLVTYRKFSPDIGRKVVFPPGTNFEMLLASHVNTRLAQIRLAPLIAPTQPPKPFSSIFFWGRKWLLGTFPPTREAPQNSQCKRDRIAPEKL